MALTKSVSYGFDRFDQWVRSGDFDRMLLRPRSTALQLFGQRLQLMRIGHFLQGFAVLLWASIALDLLWSPAKVLLLIFAITGGACVFCGVFILQATLTFWTTQSLEIINALSYGGVETARYPLSIYKSWFRHFFTYVIPLACISYYPALAILGRPDSLGSSVAFQWLAPAIGFIFLFMSLQFWRWGVRHYCSTGS
jgi:ABC-2 type transport system permease protein